MPLLMLFDVAIDSVGLTTIPSPVCRSGQVNHKDTHNQIYSPYIKFFFTLQKYRMGVCREHRRLWDMHGKEWS